MVTTGPAFSDAGNFQPTVANKKSAPGKAPEGMIWIPGGEFSMGAAVGGEGSHAMPMPSAVGNLAAYIHAAHRYLMLSADAPSMRAAS